MLSSIPDESETDCVDDIFPNDSVSTVVDCINFRKRKHSSIWKHYKVLGDGVAKCLSCEKVVKYSSTSNLCHHTRRYHNDDYKSPWENDSGGFEAELTGKRLVQQQLTSISERNKFRDLLTNFIIASDQSYLIVEQDAFRNLLNYLQPHRAQELVSADTIRSHIIETFKQKEIELLDHLKSLCVKMAFTTNIWTCPDDDNVAFCAVTVHYINEQWQLVNTLLDFFEVQESDSHPGLNIANPFYESVCTRAQLSEKIIGITLDDASNNDNFIADLKHRLPNFNEGNRLCCFNHVLNLSAKAALNICSREIELIRTAVNEICASPEKRFIFQNAATDVFPDSDVLLPIKDVPSCWNSTRDMLEKAIQYREVWIRMIPELELDMSIINWNLIEEILKFLHLFKVATEMMSAEKNVTISLVVPVYNKLLKHMEKYMEETRSENIRLAAAASHEKLISYCNVSSELCTIATILDPRLKIHYYRKKEGNDADSVALVENMFRLEYEKYAPPRAQTPELDSSDFDFMPMQQFLSEVDEYFSIVNRVTKFDDLDPLVWWSVHEKVMPNLARMAKDYLCLRASSAFSESTVSSGHPLNKDFGTPICGETVRAMTLLKNWKNKNFKICD